MPYLPGHDVMISSAWVKGEQRYNRVFWTDGKEIRSFGPKGWKIAEKDDEKKTVKIRMGRPYSVKTSEHYAAVRNAVNKLEKDGYTVQRIEVERHEYNF